MVANADAPSRDSLFQIWQEETISDSIRMDALVQMVQLHYASKQPDSARIYGNQLLDYANELDNQRFRAEALLLIGDSNISQGMPVDAKKYLNQALDIWKVLKDNKGMANTYSSLASINRYLGNPDDAIGYLKKATDLFYQLKDTASLVRPYLTMAAIYENKGETLKSLEYNQRAVAIAERFQIQIRRAVAYNNLANNYKTLGDIPNAIKYYQFARGIYEETNNYWGISSSLNNMALLLLDNGETDQPRAYLDEALIIAKEQKLVQEEAITYANLGAVYSKKKEYEQALGSFNQSLVIIESKQLVHMLPYIQLEIGNLYFLLEDFDKAEPYFLRGFENSQEKGRAIDGIIGYFYMGKLMMHKENWPEAKTYALEGYRRAEKLKYKGLESDLAQMVSTVYEKLGNSAEALRFYKIQVEHRDSLFSQENTRKLIKQEYEYAFERKAYQDSLANATMLDIQSANLKRQTLVNWFLAIFLLLVVSFGGVLYSRYRIIGRQQVRIQEEKEKAEAANAKLVEMDQSKSRFFTNISHEFRTPLTVISGMAEQLEDQARVKKLIQRNTNHLLQLINQILDLRKLESGTLPTHLVQADVAQYIRYIQESLSSLADDKGVELIYEAKESPLILDFDPEKLLRIISNLLSNALKFTPSGGFVQLQVEPVRGVDPPLYQILVSDSGAGIPADKLPYIFDRFYQVDDSVTKTGEGTGIGLTLTKELAGLLGGSIRVESEVGKGTRFLVQLPYTQEASVDVDSMNWAFPVIPATQSVLDDAPVFNSGALANEDLPTLLIVEDNPDVMEYLITCLEGRYQLLFAADGQEGIDKAIEQIPDIIISDVMMPRADGFTLCNTLKTDERTSHIPIILLTAKADVDSRIEGLQRGADAYLAKPFNQRELEAQLQNLLLRRERLQVRYSGLELPVPSEEPAIRQEDAFIQKLRLCFEPEMGNPNFDLNALSKELHLSRSQLGRKVKALTGKSPAIYLRSLRVQKGKELLMTTNLSIKEIAYDVGFSNPNYFTNSYTAEFGESPSITRNALSEGNVG